MGPIVAVIALVIVSQNARGFTPSHEHHIFSKQAFFYARHNSVALTSPWQKQPSTLTSLYSASSSTSVGGFIETELRGAAMRLHTRSQAPKEGKAPEKPPQMEPYVTTHDDYLAYLVDSQAVFGALEEAVESSDALEMLRNTGLERVSRLEKDIDFMVQEYGIDRPPVSAAGMDYANVIKTAASENKVPEFMCHYYNFYFAHTAGGLMIGKQMSKMLLNKKTLEFYKWDGNIKEIKEEVKGKIEEMAAKWTEEEKTQCVQATAAAFRGGGGVNMNLRGGMSSS